MAMQKRRRVVWSIGQIPSGQEDSMNNLRTPLKAPRLQEPSSGEKTEAGNAAACKKVGGTTIQPGEKEPLSASGRGKKRGADAVDPVSIAPASPSSGLLKSELRNLNAVPKTPQREDCSVTEHLRVCGPSEIQTLRGKMLGREVALICCGEAHEDTLSLTRRNCVTTWQYAWRQLDSGCRAGFDFDEALMTKQGVTLEDAKAWAGRLAPHLEFEVEEDLVCEDDPESDNDSGEDEHDPVQGIKNGKSICASLLFVPKGKNGKGVAYIFPSGLRRSLKHRLPKNGMLLEWADDDDEAREICRRRVAFQPVPTAEYDEVIARRKAARREEGAELFDDWLVRQYKSDDAHVQVVLEAPIPLEELELHIEPGVDPAPRAHKSLRQIEPDSDGEEDGFDEDCDDGAGGAFLDYLRRRMAEHLPSDRIFAADPRGLGEIIDAKFGGSSFRKECFEQLIGEPVKDADDVELDELNAETWNPPGWEWEDPPLVPESENVWRKPPPSWENFFGTCAELLYYSPHIKVDYAPFLRSCVGSSEALKRFFDSLYFGTVPEALAELTLDEEARSMARIRSNAYLSPGSTTLLRRPDGDGLISVSAAPVDRYLKARGSYPPRTWVSGVADRVSQDGGTDVVAEAKAWFGKSVHDLLSDMKDTPEYFMGWLRECHRSIYDDIDKTDPEAVRAAQWMESETDDNNKYNIKRIKMPDLDGSFKELLKFNPDKRVSTRKQRVLAKILIDAFQLRLVDLAAILQTAHAVSKAPAGARVAVVFYAGAHHTQSVLNFWRAQGFSHQGLDSNGYLGKEYYADGERRDLRLPSYLHNLNELFAVPSRPCSFKGFRSRHQSR